MSVMILHNPAMKELSLCRIALHLKSKKKKRRNFHLIFFLPNAASNFFVSSLPNARQPQSLHGWRRLLVDDYYTPDDRRSLWSGELNARQPWSTTMPSWFAAQHCSSTTTSLHDNAAPPQPRLWLMAPPPPSLPFAILITKMKFWFFLIWVWFLI